MNKENIHSAISLLLDDIAEQHNQISMHSGQIPIIELDIILSNIARLYEYTGMLKKLNKTEIPETHVPESTDTTPLKSKVQEPFPINSAMPVAVLKEKAPIVSFVVRPAFGVETVNNSSEIEPETKGSNPVLPVERFLKPEVEIKIKPAEITNTEPEGIKAPEPVAGHVSIIAEPNNKEELLQQSEIIPTRKTTIQTMGLFDAVATVADKYEEQPTLHDKISKNKSDSSLGKKLQKKPVDDLKRSIGINEKFSFINELFEGDLNNYNKTIDELNIAGSLEQALQLIEKQFFPKYRWNANNKSYLSLTDLVQRRYMK